MVDQLANTFQFLHITRLVIFWATGPWRMLPKFVLKSQVLVKWLGVYDEGKRWVTPVEKWHNCIVNQGSVVLRPEWISVPSGQAFRLAVAY